MADQTADQTAGADSTRTTSGSRRLALRAGAATAVAAAGAVAAASSASAAPGQAVLQGRTNLAGSTPTALVSSTTSQALQVRNSGTGAAGSFQAARSNGLGSSTASAGHYGVTAANTASAQGAGAAVGATGNNNTGVLASTANPQRFAVQALNRSAEEEDGGAVRAYGGGGTGLVVITQSEVNPAILAGGRIVSSGDVVTGGLEVFVRLDEDEQPEAVLFGTVSALGPTVQQSGVIELDETGAGEADLDPSLFLEAADLTGVSVVVTPKAQAMPGLFADVFDEVVVRVEGGEPDGVVSYLATAPRLLPDLPAARSAVTQQDRWAALVQRARAAATS